MTVAAVVPAAGRGERLGGGIPKAFRELAGRALLEHAVTALLESRAVDLVVAVVPAERCDQARRMLGPSVLVVAGGETRRQSVRRALAALPADVTGVLVHDAARPLAPSELVRVVVGAVVAGAAAVVPVLPLADTVKEVDPTGRVTATLDRSRLRTVQTPQGFTREVLVRAHAAAGSDEQPEGSGTAGAATDDAALVERIGVPVSVVPGDPMAFKITNAFDFALADLLITTGSVR